MRFGSSVIPTVTLLAGACHASARQASVSTDAIAVKVTEATTYLKPPKPVPVIHSSAYLRARQAASVG